MREIHSNSPAETEAAGRAIAGLLQPGEVVAYRGGLGMGKTTFTRGLARGLGCADEVSSPTFTLINEYRGGRLNLSTPTGCKAPTSCSTLAFTTISTPAGPPRSNGASRSRSSPP